MQCLLEIKIKRYEIYHFKIFSKLSLFTRSYFSLGLVHAKFVLLFAFSERYIFISAWDWWMSPFAVDCLNWWILHLYDSLWHFLIHLYNTFGHLNGIFVLFLGVSVFYICIIIKTTIIIVQVYKYWVWIWKDWILSGIKQSAIQKKERVFF